MKIETTNILENAVLFSLTRRAWGNTARGNKKKITTTSDSGQDENTKSRLKLSKVLIDDCEQLDALYDEQGALYYWCLNRSFDSCLREGVYFVGKNMVQEFETKIAECNAKTQSVLMPAFLKVYDEHIEKARQMLGEQFEADNYPTKAEMAGRFSVVHSWLEFTVPKDLPEDVKKRENEKLKKQLSEAGQEIVFGLREGLGEFISDLTRRLEVEPGTKGKRFTAPGAVDNLKEFLDRFKALNFANDVEIAALADKAKALVTGSDVRRMETSYQARQNLRKDFAALSQSVSKLTAERTTRRFSLDD